jgi:SM-20-related protein
MIRVADGLLPPEVFAEVAAYCAAQPMRYPWQSNKEVAYGHWNHDFVNAPTVNTTEDLSPALPAELRPVWEVLRAKLGEGIKLVRCYMNGNTFGTEGYLHVDDETGATETTIIYVNPEWTAHWAGETIFYDGPLAAAIGVVSPQPNRSVTFPGNIPHKSASVSRICPELRLTLVFKTAGAQAGDAYEGQAVLRQFLTSVGADDMPHGKGNLSGHLMRTYLLLMGAGAPEYVALAGGLHSLYGTNEYRVELCPMGTIARDYPHSEAQMVDHLVQTYRYLDRPMALENPDGGLDDFDLDCLRMIECANLYDQNELVKWPKLNAYAVDKLKSRAR